MKNELKKYWFRAKNRISQWNASDPLMIAPYLSYANDTEIIIRGRVLENEGIVVKEDDGKWENFVNSLRRLETDEAKHVNIQLKYNNKTHNSKTDNEGYFEFYIPINKSIISAEISTWFSAELTLPEVTNADKIPVTATAEIMLPASKNKLAIITDIDDTILESHVDSFMKLKLLYETFFKNVHNRKSFDGIAETLRRLCNPTTSVTHPVFYLSHSPWNLYDLLSPFLSKNKFPKGPIFLRDLGIKRGKEKEEHDHHKRNNIEHLISFYPATNFILIGDATEHDVDIYTAAFNKFPKRIIKIYIRATEKEKRNQHVREVVKLNPNAPIHLFNHSNEILCEITL